MQGHPDDDALLTPSEVAAMFRVNPKTVTRWARAGKISAIRTLGGHRRFRASEIRQFLDRSKSTRSSEHPVGVHRQLREGPVADAVAGTGVDPVTSRFSGARSAN